MPHGSNLALWQRVCHYLCSLSPREHELKLRSQLAPEEYVLIGLREERELLLGRLRELSESPASSGSQKPKLSFELPAPSFSEPPKPEETARLSLSLHVRAVGRRRAKGG